MKHNFFAGPAILSRAVIEQAASGILDLEQSGLSVLEISHRSQLFEDIIREARELVRELLGLSEQHEVLFLSGGASTQFFMVACNLLTSSDKAGYIDTGSWSTKAIKEARLFGQIEVLASSKDKNYTYIPKNFPIPKDLKYVHITSNNTIFGTQYKEWPKTEHKLVCDMSSDIFSRPFDAAKFGVIYAGAQKNLGPAGTTLVILDKEFISTGRSDLPSMLNYQTHIQKQSTYNTPPVISIYISMLNLRWIKEMGGVEHFQKANNEKARTLYSEIERNSLFMGTSDTKDRSAMNVCFLVKDSGLEEPFLDLCQEANIVGIKGHRSVGGFRASMYNALPLDSVITLVGLMQNFEEKYG